MYKEIHTLNLPAEESSILRTVLDRSTGSSFRKIFTVSLSTADQFYENYFVLSYRLTLPIQKLSTVNVPLSGDNILWPYSTKQGRGIE